MVTWDLRRLALLRELHERGSLVAVAKALRCTPSAVSQQLAVLEREAGVPLVEKAGRGVRLNGAGRLLAGHAAVILAAADAARAEVDALHDEVRGVVRAGGLQSALRQLLIPALVRTGIEHAALRVELTEVELEQALPDLRVGALDLAISDEYDGQPRPRPHGFVIEVLHDEPLHLVLPAGHALARGRGPVSMVALRDATWVASAMGTGHHAVVVSTCRSYGGYEPDLRHRTNDAESQLELVRNAAAIGLLPAMTLPPGDTSIAVRDIAEAVVRRRLLLIIRNGPRAPAFQAYISAVQDVARALGPSADPVGEASTLPRSADDAPLAQVRQGTPSADVHYVSILS